MRRWAKTTAMALLLAAPVQAQPDDTVAQVEALAGEARALYDAGEFGQAVARYLEAYKLQPTAAVLYNVAVIYDKKIQEVDLAIEYYRRYIASPDADPKAVQRATARLQALKAEKEARRQADLSTLPTEPARDPGPPGVSDTVAPPPPMSGQSVAGYVLVGTGLVGLAGGGVMGYLAGDSADKFSASTEFDEKTELREQAQSRALVADVLYGVGAAAVVTGILLVVLDDGPADAQTGRLQVGPTAGGGVGVWLGGSL